MKLSLKPVFHSPVLSLKVYEIAEESGLVTGEIAVHYDHNTDLHECSEQDIARFAYIHPVDAEQVSALTFEVTDHLLCFNAEVPAHPEGSTPQMRAVFELIAADLL